MTTTRPLRRAVRVVAAIAILVPALPACSSWEPPREPGATALVVGGRANMPVPQLARTARELTTDAFLSRDTLLIVEVSGDPRIAYSAELSHGCSNDETCRGAVAGFHRDLAGLVGRVQAGTAEADPLGAVLLAARELKAVRNDGPRQIIVIDSGLQTTGAMPLQAPGALHADWEAVVEPWLADGMLADLEEVEVLWTGLGATAPPQPAPPPGTRDALERLWHGVLTAGGAKPTIVREELPDQPPTADLPAVSTVSFEDEQPDETGDGCFRIRDDQVGFLPSQAAFRDPARAREVLAPIAEELIDNQLSVTVVGTTALPEPDPYPLSVRRAEAVVDELVELGVARHALIPGGVGTNFTDYRDPHDAQGRFVETLAVQNRLVFIQPVGRPCE